MTIIPRVLFVALLVLGPAIIWATSGALPDRVATHFGHDGLANGWMSRDGYRAFMLALGTLVPLFVVLMAGLDAAVGQTHDEGAESRTTGSRPSARRRRWRSC